MAINIKSFVEKLKEKVQNSKDNKAAEKTAARIQQYVEDCVKRVDIYAGLNMQDAQLTTMLLEKHLQSGVDLSDQDRSEVQMIIEIAGAQRKYNNDIILDTGVAEVNSVNSHLGDDANVRKMDKIFGNQNFTIASNGVLNDMERMNTRAPLGFTNFYQASMSTVRPIINPDRSAKDKSDDLVWSNDGTKNFDRIVDADHVTDSRIRIGNLLKGLNDEQQIGALTELLGSESAAIEYNTLVKCPDQSKKALLEQDCALYAIRQREAEKMVSKMQEQNKGQDISNK